MGSKRKLTNAVVTLSSWACVDGHGHGCVTPAGAEYSLPITLNIYDTATGALLASKTQTFDVSYRPSANPAKCGVGTTTWYSTAEKTCFNGFAQDVTFTFDGTTTLPNTVRYGITYGTSNYGAPDGVQACISTPAGCFYDSLNVALTEAVRASGSAPVRKSSTRMESVVTDLSAALTPAVQFKAGN